MEWEEVEGGKTGDGDEKMDDDGHGKKERNNIQRGSKAWALGNSQASGNRFGDLGLALLLLGPLRVITGLNRSFVGGFIDRHSKVFGASF